MTEETEAGKRKLEATEGSEAPETTQPKKAKLDNDNLENAPEKSDSKSEDANEPQDKQHQSEASQVKETTNDSQKEESEADSSEVAKDSKTGTKTPEDKIREHNKPVFGAASKFGNAFDKLAKEPSIFGKASSTEPDSSKSTPPAFGSGSFGLLFGSNSKFSNAFEKALAKPSFLDGPNKDSGDDAKEDGKPKATQQYKQVDLEAKEVKTGEEDEKSLFTTTAKIFELDLSNIKSGWKERGLGPLHLNQSILDPKKVRIVMRSQGLLRVVLNYKITPETELIKGLEASMSPGKFLRLNVASEKKVAQYLIKFSSEEKRNELTEKVDELKKKIAAE